MEIVEQDDVPIQWGGDRESIVAPTFLTGVDIETTVTPPPALEHQASSASIDLGATLSEHSIHAEVEDVQEQPLPYDLSTRTPAMPERVPLDELVTVIVDSLSFDARDASGNEALRAKFAEFFKCPDSKAIIQDAYWFFFSKFFKSSDDASAQQSQQEAIFTRMSDHFVQLLFGVPPDFKDPFFQRYYDALAQTIFQSMYIIYPKSRTFLNEEIRLKMLDLLAKWTNGFAPTIFSTSHWSQGWGLPQPRKTRPSYQPARSGSVVSMVGLKSSIPTPAPPALPPQRTARSSALAKRALTVPDFPRETAMLPTSAEERPALMSPRFRQTMGPASAAPVVDPSIAAAVSSAMPPGLEAPSQSYRQITNVPMLNLSQLHAPRVHSDSAFNFPRTSSMASVVSTSHRVPASTTNLSSARRINSSLGSNAVELDEHGGNSCRVHVNLPYVPTHTKESTARSQSARQGSQSTRGRQSSGDTTLSDALNTYSDSFRASMRQVHHKEELAKASARAQFAANNVKRDGDTDADEEAAVAASVNRDIHQFVRGQHLTKLRKQFATLETQLASNVAPPPTHAPNTARKLKITLPSASSIAQLPSAPLPASLISRPSFSASVMAEPPSPRGGPTVAAPMLQEAPKHRRFQLAQINQTVPVAMRRDVRAFGHSLFLEHYLRRNSFGRFASEKLRASVPYSVAFDDERSEAAIQLRHQHYRHLDESRTSNSEQRVDLVSQRIQSSHADAAAAALDHHTIARLDRDTGVVIRAMRAASGSDQAPNDLARWLREDAERDEEAVAISSSQSVSASLTGSSAAKRIGRTFSNSVQARGGGMVVGLSGGANSTSRDGPAIDPSTSPRSARSITALHAQRSRAPNPAIERLRRDVAAVSSSTDSSKTAETVPAIGHRITQLLRAIGKSRGGSAELAASWSNGSKAASMAHIARGVSFAELQKKPSPGSISRQGSRVPGVSRQSSRTPLDRQGSRAQLNRQGSQRIPGMFRQGSQRVKSLLGSPLSEGGGNDESYFTVVSGAPMMSLMEELEVDD